MGPGLGSKIDLQDIVLQQLRKHVKEYEYETDDNAFISLPAQVSNKYRNYWECQTKLANP